MNEFIETIIFTIGLILCAMIGGVPAFIAIITGKYWMFFLLFVSIPFSVALASEIL